MIEEHAVVVGIEQQDAMLEIIRRTPCGLCGQTRGCGISIWGRLFGHRNNVFKALNQINAKLGDSVIVGIEEQALLSSSLLVYGVPLVTVFIGALLGNSVISPDSDHADRYAVIGAVIGLLAGIFWVKGHAAGRGFDGRYRPVILRAANPGVINLACKRGE